MAMSLNSIERTLQAAFGPEFPYEVDREHHRILLVVPTQQYVNADGESQLCIAIEQRAKGRYIELCAPEVYSVKDCPHVHAVCRTLLGICLRTAVLQYAVDESDGEVRATVEIILADGVLTAEQLRENLEYLIGGIDQFHSHVDRAIRSGEITFPKEERPRSVLPVAGPSDLPQANLEADTETVLREMWNSTMAEGRELWKKAAESGHEMRHW